MLPDPRHAIDAGQMRSLDTSQRRLSLCDPMAGIPLDPFGPPET